jgi:hypothetical protein
MAKGKPVKTVLFVDDWIHRLFVRRVTKRGIALTPLFREAKVFRSLKAARAVALRFYPRIPLKDYPYDLYPLSIN